MTYKVKTFADIKDVDWNAVEKAEIKRCLWENNEYCPRAYGKLAYIKDKGFYVKLCAYEQNPKADYLNFYDNVYCDSCLEFFADYSGKREKYVNFEVNSRGVSLIAFGDDDVDNRECITEYFKSIPDVKTKIYKDRWEVYAFFSLENIERVFPGCKFEKGYEFAGNFYKCGDETEIPHYGSYAEITPEKMRFHRPECFAKFVIE